MLEGITMPKLSYESSFDGYVTSAAFPGPRASKGRLEVKVWAAPIFGDLIQFSSIALAYDA